MELKTLKYFEINERLKRHSYDAFCGTGLDYYDVNSQDYASKEELKSEAIKWVKEDISNYPNGSNEQSKDWMKRFDITEEDLKEEFKLEKRSFLDRISYLLNEVKCYRITEEQFELQMKVAVRDLK